MTNNQKLRMFLATVWAPWLIVLSWNAGNWLTVQVFGSGFEWWLPAKETWVATTIWAALMLLSWALGSAYSWLVQSPRSTANQ